MSKKYFDVEFLDDDEPDDFEPTHQSGPKKFRPPKDDYRQKRSRDKEDYYRREYDFDDDR